MRGCVIFSVLFLIDDTMMASEYKVRNPNKLPIGLLEFRFLFLSQVPISSCLGCLLYLYFLLVLCFGHATLLWLISLNVL